MLPFFCGGPRDSAASKKDRFAERIAAVCFAQSSAAIAYLNRALDEMQARAWRRGAVDWPRLRAEALGRAAFAQTPADTYDAIRFALEKHAKYIVVVPCCQAEVAGVLRQNKSKSLGNALTEIWRHPLHTREFGSQITNVLRCLQLEAHGYQVSVTELVGWEHSMKNELIIAQYKDLPRRRPTERLNEVMETLGLAELRERFFVEA